MTIVAVHYISVLPNKREPMAHHKAGLTFTATGYGKRIPTENMVKLPGSTRWRRVYCCVYGSIGTCYVEQGKDWVVIN